MTLSFRAKLLASHLAVAAAVVLVVVLALDRSLGADLMTNLDRRLERQARGAVPWVIAGRHPDRMAARLAEIVPARVTIFDRDGVVLADSEAQGVARPPLPNQADAPEVAAALAGRVGRATRPSADGRQRIYYLALLAGDQQVLRLGVPLSDVDEPQDAVRRRLLFAGAVGCAVALALGLLAARVGARPVRAMTATARRIAGGDYAIELPPPSPDEFGVLSHTLASLARQLGAHIGELTAERDRLAAILTGMVEGVLVVAPGGVVVEANPSAARLLGAGASLPGQSLRELGVAPDLLAPLERAVARGEAASDVIETAGRALAITIQPLAADVVVVLHDLTRVRQLEAVRRDFIANLSHELRTPVTAIRGYAETLLGGATDEATARQFLEVIHRHAQRIGRLVGDLLQLADIEARGAAAAALGPVPVRAVAAQAIGTLQRRAGPAGVTIELLAGPDLTALGDAGALEQVLENLLDNAVKYGRPGGRIEVAVERAGDRVRLTVTDDGPGVAAEHLPRLFERFYRVDAGRSREQGGTGLGLAIVKHLVEAMAGRVAVTSEPGRGCRFAVELPEAM